MLSTQFQTRRVVLRIALAAFTLSIAAANADAASVSIDFDAGTGPTLGGTTGVDIADSPIAIGSATLDLSGVDGEFDASPFSGFAIAPTDDRNLDFLFENTAGQSTVVLNGLAASDVVSITVYASSFRDTNFTYDASTTLVAAGGSATIINALTGETSYAFTFGAGTTDTEGNLAGVDITITSIPVPAALPAGLAMLGLAACRSRRMR